MAESPSEIEGTRRKGGRRAREAADKVSGRTLICLLAGANVRLPTASSWWHVPLKLSWEEFDSQWTKRTVNQSVHLWNSYETFYILIFSVVHSFHLAATRHRGILRPAISRMGSFVCSIGPP